MEYADFCWKAHKSPWHCQIDQGRVVYAEIVILSGGVVSEIKYQLYILL